MVIPPEELLWYRLYVSNHYLMENPWLWAKFWLWFWLPYDNYKDLVEWVRVDPLFDRWCGYKIRSNKCSPVELLVLGSLWYLGWGWTFDDIEECTAVSKEVHHVFFTCSLNLVQQRFMRGWLSLPFLLTNLTEYANANLPGCVS